MNADGTGQTRLTTTTAASKAVIFLNRVVIAGYYTHAVTTQLSSFIVTFGAT